MIPVSYKIYKSSVLATVLSILGTGFTMCSLLMAIVFISSAVTARNYADLPAEILTVLMIAAIGLGIEKAAYNVNEKKKLKTIVEKLRAEGQEAQISESVPFALSVYNICPGKKMQLYIASLNPQTGEIIASNLTKSKKS